MTTPTMTTPETTTRTLRYRDARSDKFWSITLEGAAHTVRFGRTGTAGQTQQKAFPDPAAARAAMEKLVAEKLGKGYVEGGAAAPVAPDAAAVREAAPAAPAAPVPPAPAPAPAPPAPAGAPPPARERPPLLEVTRSIDLDPRDTLWVTWRERSPAARPAPPPFDRQEALAAIRAMGAGQVRYWSARWDWAGAGVGPALTAEGARFWLAAIFCAAAWERRLDPQQVATALETAEEAVDLDPNALQATFSLPYKQFPPEVIVPLATLLAPETLVEVLTRDRLPADDVPNARLRYREEGGLMSEEMVAGYRRHVLPYLTAEEKARLVRLVLPRVDPTAWPADRRERPNGAYYLAAMLGAHEAVRAVVDSWADDFYRGESWFDEYHRPQEIVFGLGSAAEVESQMRRLRLALREPDYARAWLAHTGYGALDLVRDAILSVSRREDAARLGAVLALVVAPEGAPPMLELMLSSRAPSVGREWLDLHPAQAIAGLLPLAGARGRLAEAATDYLRKLSRRGLGAQLEGALASLVESGSLTREAASRLGETLAGEGDLPPFDDATTPDWLATALQADGAGSRRKVVPWARGVDLPAVVVGQRRLSDSQADALVAALAASTLERPQALLTTVRQHAGGASLEAFAWAVFEAWLAEGAPSRDGWALQALGLLGGDATAIRLASLIRVWPGESQHRRAVQGLDCLRAIGTDTALMEINGIAQRVKFKGLQAHAVACMEGIARDRGLSRARLEDRIVPDCGLDERGQRTFDFGPRRFTFALGPGMKPAVRDAAGALRHDLPKPNARDDAALAATAVAEWKLLKQQVAQVTRVQALRLEQAMVVGRHWTPAEFDTLLVRHPLQTHLVRLLVWGVYGPDGKGLNTTFRVTEDLTYAGVQDDSYALPPDAVVGIVHPLQLDEGQRAAWGELLSDYDVVPPFPQLGRPVYRLEGQETEASEITRFEKVDVPPATLVFTLEKLGWQRGLVEDAGVFHLHTRAFPGAGVTAVVEYAGVPVGTYEDWEDQRMEQAYFLPYVLEAGISWSSFDRQRYPDRNKAVPLREIDPVAISEVLSDLSQIAARGHGG